MTFLKSKNEKRRKIEEKIERERQLKEINDAKRRRNENLKNNLDEINTNLEQNQNNIDFNSERKNILETNEQLINDDNKY